MKRFFAISAVLFAMHLMVCQISVAQTFSIEFGSVDSAGGSLPPFGDDILAPSFTPGVPPGPPVIPGGFSTGTVFDSDVDAFTYGRQTNFNPNTDIVDFSVDGSAFGAPGSGVFFEVTSGGVGEQNYDVYRTSLTTGFGTNAQKHDGNGFGPGGVAAPLGFRETQLVGAGVPFDPGVDGYDTRSVPNPNIYWSWENRVWAPVPGSTSGADVMISASVPGYNGLGTVFASSFALGLDLAGAVPDNIDALEVYDYGTIGVFDPGTDLILFSLDPLSGSLGAFGLSAGDILISTGGGAFGLAIPHFALGLTPQDNLTALSIVSIPEPGSAMICLVAFGFAAARRRRRK